jgi:hypothetical protein
MDGCYLLHMAWRLVGQRRMDIPADLRNCDTTDLIAIQAAMEDVPADLRAYDTIDSIRQHSNERI